MRCCHVFLVGSLGISVVMLGVIEGLAEATAQIVKVFSGLLSDRFGNRKYLAIAGYGLAALTKPLFPLAASATAVLVARLLDRVGKGIRGAPRDAMVADMTPPELRGAAFGLRQSLDTVGAFAGPLIAVALLSLAAFEIRDVLWVACLPAFIAVGLLAFGLTEPAKAASKQKPGFDVMTVRRLGAPFWRVVVVTGFITLARFSEAFLVLRVAQTGLAIAFVPLVLVVMSLVYSLTSFPVGVMSDRIGRKGLLACGLVALFAADIVLGWSTSVVAAFVGIGLWGLHMGLTQGLLSALVADTAPEDLRGTAFGFFNLASGVIALASSVLAGVLWQQVGPWATFAAGALFALLALLSLPLLRAAQAD